MYESLLNQVSVHEMMEMRENEGMSNREIAEALGTTQTTVRKYIGNQPKGMRKYRSKGVIYPPSMRSAEPPKNEPSEALLVVANRCVNVVGSENEYEIDYSAQRVRMRRQKDGKFYWDFAFDELAGVAAELGVIAKKTNELRITPEMW